LNNKFLDTLSWKGDATIATMTTTGGDWSSTYRPEKMFDGDIRTFWFSREKQASIKIIFKKPILFHGFQITARHELVTGRDGVRYQNVCAYLDGSQSICTHPTQNRTNNEIVTAKTPFFIEGTELLHKILTL